MGSGLIHVYMGDGKGKTTAAIGLAVRAAGYGQRVVFGQMLKGRRTGEIASLEALGVIVIRSEKEMGFIWEMDDERKEAFKQEQIRLFAEIREAAFGGAETGLLVFDEALDVIKMGMLDEQSVRDLLEKKPEKPEMVFTGRSGPEWFLEKADYVTEMKKIKHPFDLGIKARKAIEF